MRTYLRRLRLSSRLISHLKTVDRGIEVNGEFSNVLRRLQVGDVISLRYEDERSSPAAVPADLPIGILYEDGDAVVADKPPYMPTHPSHGHACDTLANALAYRYADLPFVFRPIVRLDRNTSGVVLAARNARSAALFSAELQRGGFEKVYLAVVDGEMSGSGRVIKSLRRSAESIIVRETCDFDAEGAQYAETGYEVIATGGGRSLLRVFPYTGRTHQIRVHLASIGHPVTGDDLYGTASPLIGRHALHAQSLSFTLCNGERTTVSSRLPDDMAGLCRASGIDTYE